MRPGDLGWYDRSFAARHVPWLHRWIHGYFRASVEGLERLPSGPFLGVGNHSGGVLIPDTLVWLAAYQASGREPPLLTLAHDAMFRSYPRQLSEALARLGAIRADESICRRALSEGYAVQVYPGGDHDACRRFGERHRIVFAGRTGYARIALDQGVPIVPVVAIGGHETLLVLRDGADWAARSQWCRRQRLATLPLSISIPWGLWLGPLPGYLPLPSRIVVRVLDPIDPHEFDRSDERAHLELDAMVRTRMQHELDTLARQRRFPVIG